MLAEQLVREQPEMVRSMLQLRHASADTEQALDQWMMLDASRRRMATQCDEQAQQLHTLRQTVSPNELRQALCELQAIQRALHELTAQARQVLMRLPNLVDARVPAGKGDAYYQELRRWGEPPTLSFAPRRHEELGATLGILDLPRATRLAGPRFPLLIGAGARLARALAALMLDMHAARGYIEIAPPHLLNMATLEGSGHLPQHADEVYNIPRDGLLLSPTAEAQLVALHAGETLAASKLPLAFTACTPAFRREAGSTRATTHGLLRQHQFDKVELVRIAAPEESESAFDTLLTDAEAVLQRLELPYHVVMLCAGDLPFASQYTYDLEVWMPGQQRYVEVSSVSNCGTFQARRLNLRYRPPGGGRPRYPHTLNGAALAIGRTLAAVLENGQQADGTVVLPQSLSAYLPEKVLPAPF